MSSHQSTQITHALVKPHRIPIHVPFTISSESLPSAELLVIEIHDADGHIGLGEAAPFPSLTYDSMTSAQAVAQRLVEEIQDMTLDQALSHLRARKPDVSGESITGYVGVECAVYDLQAQHQERSLAALFGGPRQQKLATDITLPIMSPEAVAGFTDLYRPYQFQTIKVKVSGYVTQDLEMIEALVAQVPPNTAYILDGNQGFTIESSKKLVDACLAREMKLLFFEQPLPEADRQALVALSRELPIPICVDETVRTQKDLQDILRLGIRPIVNIKIMKSGVEEAIRIIQFAEKAGCQLMIGGMLESEIAMAFSLHIACGTGVITYADLDTPFFFKQRLTEQSPWHPCRAELQLPEGHGLGLKLKNATSYGVAS